MKKLAKAWKNVDIKAFLKNNLGEIIVFAVSILILCLYLVLRVGALSISEIIGNDDGRLYISVADNLIDNGHFIQNHRDFRDNMVIPFGLSALFVPIRLISRHDALILILQYILYGTTCVFLFRAERNFFGSSGILSAAYFIAGVCYRYCCCAAVIGLTEPYYLFLLSAALLVLSDEKMQLCKKLVWINILTFAAMAIRPVLSVFYLASLAATAYFFIKRKIGLKIVLPLAIVPVVILAANMLVNYREVGQAVLFQNYAAVDIFLANNEHSLPQAVDITAQYAKYFPDMYIDYNVSGERFDAMFGEYLRENPGKFIFDTVKNSMRCS